MLILSTFSAVAVLIAFLINVRVGVLTIIIVKPILDASWNYSIFGINLLQIIGTLIPLFVFVYALQTPNRREVPHKSLWLLYVIYFSFVSMFGMLEFGMFRGFESALKVTNGFCGYLMLQLFFRNKEDLKPILFSFILAGIFPIAIGLFQVATGVVWQERTTVGLTRNVGLYHDAFSFRHYGFQTLAGILLYWSYFANKSRIKQFMLLILSASASVVIFKAYSKASYIIAGSWLIIWMVCTRKFGAMALALTVIVGAGVVIGVQQADEVATLFSKEMVLLEENVSELDQKRTLGGRWFIWDRILSNFLEQSTFRIFFGTGKSGGGSHNDFLRALLGGGVFGLTLYLALLGAMGIRTWQTFREFKTPLSITALMLYAMWLIDSMGLTPGLYPGYQWFVWGLIGLAVGGMQKPLDNNAETIKPSSLQSTSSHGQLRRYYSRSN